MSTCGEENGKTEDGRPCPRLAQPEHSCPYREEISDDSETLCTCCADCESECAQDV